MGYFPVNETKPTPGFSPYLQHQFMHQFLQRLGMEYIGHDNVTNKDHYYIQRNSSLGTFFEIYMEQIETYAMTAVPVEVGDKILHTIQQLRTDFFSPTEYVKPEKFPPLPPGSGPLPKLQFPTQNATNNKGTPR